ncbi:MAG: hypothetical protein ACLRM9_02905 [Collinsella aerofaciens]
MVALALDIGETGLASPSRAMARWRCPSRCSPAAEVTGMAKTFRYLVEDYEPISW